MVKKKRNLFAKAAAAFLTGALLISGALVSAGGSLGELNLANSQEAAAGVDGGGTPGGGGGGGGGGGAIWYQMPADKLYGGSITMPDSFYASALCRNAIAYYILVPPGVDPWSNGYTLMGLGDVDTTLFPGGVDVANAIAGNTGNGYGWSANYMRSKNYICLDNPDRLVDSVTVFRVVRDTAGDGSGSYTKTGDYSWTTEISPQIVKTVDGKVVDPIGENNLNRQSSGAKKSNFAALWDEINSKKNSSSFKGSDAIKNYKDKIEKAIAADKKASKSTVNLNKKNQEGMAEGGVLNIQEQTLPATVKIDKKETGYKVQYRVAEGWSLSGWKWVSGWKDASGSIVRDNQIWFNGALNGRPTNSATERAKFPVAQGPVKFKRVASTATASKATQKNTGFWQIIAAHCNEAGLTALKSAMGNNLTKLNSGDSTTSVSGLYRTKLYSSKPSQVPLGNTNSGLSAAQRATGSLGFYDKECPFDCTPQRDSAGASLANDAVNNVHEDGFEKTATGLYGAKSSDEVNSSYLEIFRDNEKRSVRADVWYPVSGAKGVSYDGGAPKTTLISRWAGGTPKIDEEFKAYVTIDGKSQKVFDAASTKQNNQKNFDEAKGFKGSTVSQFVGLIDQVDIQSTWASDSGKPQAMQFAWEYNVPVTSSVPSSLGFTSGTANVQLGSMVNTTANIDGRCWGEFGTTTQKTWETTKNSLLKNTGTGATTNFTVSDGKVATSRNLVLNFVRGTSE